VAPSQTGQQRQAYSVRANPLAALRQADQQWQEYRRQQETPTRGAKVLSVFLLLFGVCFLCASYLHFAGRIDTKPGAVRANTSTRTLPGVCAQTRCAPVERVRPEDGCAVAELVCCAQGWGFLTLGALTFLPGDLPPPRVQHHCSQQHCGQPQHLPVRAQASMLSCGARRRRTSRGAAPAPSRLAALRLAAALACAACATAAPGAGQPGREAAADAALGEALAWFGGGREPARAPAWRLASLQATLGGAGFHRRRRFEASLRRGGARGEGAGPPAGACLAAARPADAGAAGALPAALTGCGAACPGACEVAVLQARLGPEAPRAL